MSNIFRYISILGAFLFFINGLAAETYSSVGANKSVEEELPLDELPIAPQEYDRLEGKEQISFQGDKKKKSGLMSLLKGSSKKKGKRKISSVKKNLKTRKKVSKKTVVKQKKRRRNKIKKRGK